MGPEYIKRHGLTFQVLHLLPVALYNVTGLSSGDDIKDAMYAFSAWIDGDCTTELDFNGQDMEGLWPSGFEAQRAIFLHPTYAVTPDREPLGILDAWMRGSVDAWMWAREPLDANGHRSGIKESIRWIVLENGCKVDALQLSQMDRVERALVLFHLT